MAHFTESFLADLGRIVAAWSHIETVFDTMCLLPMLLKGNPSATEIDVNALLGMGFERRIRTYREYLSTLVLDANAQATADRFLSQMMTLRRERDEIAHGLWDPQIERVDDNIRIVPDAARKLFKSWHNSKPHKEEIVTQERLKEIFERMHSLFWELSELLHHPQIISPKTRQS